MVQGGGWEVIVEGQCGQLGKGAKPEVEADLATEGARSQMMTKLMTAPTAVSVTAEGGHA